MSFTSRGVASASSQSFIGALCGDGYVTAQWWTHESYTVPTLFLLVSSEFKRPFPCVEIVVEPHTLERSARGGITGRVWLRDGRQEVQADFPEVGWSDFPVALLSAWAAELQRFARVLPSDGAVATCHFMDGPYSFTVHAEGAGAWRISCVEERSKSRSAPSQVWVTDSASFLHGLRRAARAILAACDARGWWNADTEALRRFVESGSQDRSR
jgi:hypothetical protein